VPKPSNLYQRNGIFYARIQVAGAERRRSLETANRREAERRLKLFLAENSPYHGTIRRSFDDVMDGFLKDAEHRLKAKTVKRYEVSSLQLEQKFGGRWWDSITRQSVVDYIDARKEEGAKIPTIRRDLTVLSQAAEWAIEHGIGAINPVGQIGKRQLRYKKPTFVRPTAQSIEATINAAYGNLEPLARFLLATGMRLDEGATLRWSDIDEVRRVATLTDTKNGQSRAVALNEPALAVLKGQDRAGQFVFPSRLGKPYTQASTNWQEAKARAQKAAHEQGWRYTPHTIHALRHIYAIDYLANGGNLYALQRQLGHGTIRQTEEYLQFLSPEEAERSKIGSAHTPAHTQAVSA
jgi:integrase/recombinase XerD